MVSMQRSSRVCALASGLTCVLSFWLSADREGGSPGLPVPPASCRCPPPSRREGSGSLRAKHLRPGASSLAEVVPHEPHEALVLLVHAGRDAEVAVLAVDGLDALQEELLHVHARLQDLGGALAGHGGVDEHVVAVGWVRLEADCFELFGEDVHPVVVVLDLVLDFLGLSLIHISEPTRL